MIISPPFLPSPITGEIESDFLARAMFQPPELAQNTTARRGSCPISASLMWHTGLHLRAPRIDERYVPVRAIADGKVIYVRQPAGFSEDPKHPLNYTSNGDVQWTDNGCVILRHTTDIGESYGKPVTFTYYSLTMHLSAIEPAVVVGTKKETQVYRKDVLGKAGRILGSDPTIHFETCFQEPELKKLVGRDPIWIELETEPPPTKDGRPVDGRTDCVYGDTVIYLPAGTAISHGKQKPSPQRVMQSAKTPLDTAQWVVLKYEKGELRIRSMDRMGRDIGKALAVPDAEYDLYKTACDLHAKAVRPGVPSSPSGWYELLRFGRNLGPDPLPADAVHWQQVPTAQGIVWVDLNYPGTCKFSEADYLTVMGFKFISDDRDPLDQRAQSHQIDRLLQDPTPGSLERQKPGHKNDRLGSPEVMEKLKQVIFRFDTDWEKSTVEQRMGWLRDKKQTDQPMGDKKWAEFMAHCDLLCISDLPQEYKDAMWNISPFTFIEMMRKCTWLSTAEFMQLVPEKIVRGKGAGMKGPFFYEDTQKPAGSLLATHSQELNRMLRKFGVVTPLRMSAFLANSIQETTWWSDLKEGSGETLRYAPWYGRGFLQLTNPGGKFDLNSNYGRYFAFKSSTLPTFTPALLSQWAKRILEVPYEACASAGAYWSWMGANKVADKISNNNVRTTVVLDQKSQNLPGKTIAIYENTTFRRVACTINLPADVDKENPQLNGLIDRYSAFAVAQVILLDSALFPGANKVMSSKPENFSSKRK